VITLSDIAMVALLLTLVLYVAKQMADSGDGPTPA
jgi:hypothetical protein